MKSKIKNLVITIIFLQNIAIFGQSAEITIDENFDDWTSNLATFYDGIDNPGGIDLLDF